MPPTDVHISFSFFRRFYLFLRLSLLAGGDDDDLIGLTVVWGGVIDVTVDP